MIDILSVIIIGGLSVAYFILAMTKLGVRNELIAHSRSRLFAEMLECDFCLSWWMNLALFIIVAIVTNDLRMILCAFASTPITRFII